MRSINLSISKVSDILSPSLAEVAKEQFNNEHRKQMIIELVGSQFKRSYLTEERDNPWLLVRFLREIFAYN